jgi:ATP-dependent protease ClpP protease subunit
MSKSWFTMRASKRDGKAVGNVAIYGDIGSWGVTASDFRNALDGIGDVDELHVHISSDGGDVTAGIGIFNLLAAHLSKKVITVDSHAASMGSVIFMAGDERIMPKNTFLMIHNPWGAVMGDADEVISFGEGLKLMEENLVGAYVDATGLKAKEVRDMMAKETWLTAAQAKKLGFATKVVEPRDMNAKTKAVLASSKFATNPAMAGLTKGVKAMAKKPNAQSGADTDDGEFEMNADEIRASLLSDQKEIRSMCKLAGYADLAEGFIAEDKSLADVMAALEAKKAADDEEDDEDDDKPFPPKKDKGKSKRKASGELNTRRPADDGKAVAGVDTAAVYDKFNGRK